MKKIQQQDETSIYISDEGYLCISQIDMAGESQIVAISPNNFQDFLELIQANINENNIE